MYNLTKSKKEERLQYLDVMRLVAICAVVMIHVAAQKWYAVSVYSFEWNVFNFFDALVRFGVPVFVMISGTLFLGKPCDMKQIYTKNILRVTIAYVVWSVFYAVFANPGVSKRTMLLEAIKGKVHLWYIPMIIGLYMLLPLLNKIVEVEKLVKYYLILSAIFVFAIPELLTIFIHFGGTLLADIARAFQNILYDMHFDFVFGYPFYFIGGYYLNRLSLEKKQRWLIYFLGICGFLTTVFLSKVASESMGKACEVYYGNFTVNVMLQSIAVFVWIKYNFQKKETKKLTIGKTKILSVLSKYSFGAYLVHMYIIWILNKEFNVNTLSFSAIPAVLTVWGITVVASFLISAILNQIPVLKKYIV